MSPAGARCFHEYCDSLRQMVDTRLRHYCQFGSGCPERLRQAIEYGLLGPGKRLRPLLVLLACETCGSSVQRALPAACAVEMVHAYSLIHDDLPAMDDDALRRGRPTCHIAFDEATAILAGDALLARALEVIAGGLQPPQVAAECCRQLAHAAGATAMVGGQADDLAAEGREGTLEALESIHRRKTGAMLLVSLRLGALVAGASDEQMQALSAYGEKLGLAFQIVDDLLDRTGDQQQIGKRAGADTDRRKLTFPALLGEAESRRRAGQLVDGAVADLSVFGPPAAALEALARFVLERDR